MSLHPKPIPPVPEATARVARADTVGESNHLKHKKRTVAYFQVIQGIR